MRRLVAALALLTACGGGGDLLLPGSGVPAAITVVSGGQQTGRVGETIPDSIVVSVTDGEGRPVQGATVVFAFLDASPGAALDPDTATSTSDGHAWAHAVLGTRVGAQQGQVQALTPDGTDPPTASFTLTALPENANGIVAVSGNDQSGQVGSTLPAPLVVAVTDGFGNPIEGVAIDWTIDGGGQVSETSTTTGADGQTSVTRTLGTAAGSQHTFASATGLAGSPVTFTHMATSGGAAQVNVLAGNNQTAAPGTTLPDSLVIAVLDAQGNPVPGTAVAWVPGAGGGTLAPASGTTDAQGRASAAWTLGPQPDTNTASAVVSGIGIGIAAFRAIAAGAPTTTAITSDTPNPSSAGQTVTVDFKVSAASGTPGGSVTVTDGQVSCSGTLSHGAGSCTLALLTAGTRTLTASYAGQNAFAPSSGTASHEVQAVGPPGMVLSRQPSSSAASGVLFDRQPEVQLRDPLGHDLHTPGVAVGVGIASGGGTLQGTRSATTDANGRAGFTDLAISGTAGTYSLGFSATGFNGVTSDQIVLAQVPSALTSSVVADPMTIPAGSSSTITVTVRDASSTPLSGIQVTLDASGGENSITAVTPVTGADGVATFAFSSTAAEVKTITAKADGTTVGQVSVTVEIVPTQTSIIDDLPDPSAEGDVVDVRFSVTSAAGTPTGDVTVESDHDNERCKATVEVGHCGIRLKKSGTNVLTATYAGNRRFADSSGTADHEVHGH